MAARKAPRVAFLVSAIAGAIFARLARPAGPEQAQRLVLVRHAMRLDHSEGTGRFYNETDAPWDPPLDEAWVRRHVDSCKPAWREWLSGFPGELRLSTSPLRRTVDTARILAKLWPTGAAPSVAAEPCVVEKFERIRHHARRFSAARPDAPVRETVPDPSLLPGALGRSASDCVAEHERVEAEHLPGCCRKELVGRNAPTWRRVECFASCVRRAAGTALVVTHAGVARNICYRMSGDLRCMLHLSYMESIELKRDRRGDWHFAARHARPACGDAGWRWW